MVRNFVLAAALAAGGLALAAPTTASANDFSIGIGVGHPGYGSYYGPVQYRYRDRWDDRPRRYYAPRPYYGDYGSYRPRRPAYGYGSYRPRPTCRTVTVRSWNGYRYVTRTRETCGRSYNY